MASGGDEDADAVLSDVEGVDALPIAIINSSLDEISPERYRELLAELDRERQSREAVESSKADLQVSFNRLKAFAHEAIMKRDECMRQRDEALCEKEEVLRTVSAELVEANRMKDEMANQLDKVVKERDGLRLEIGNSTHMLVTGIEKISGKVSNFKNFVAAGLPQSQKYSGLATVAYGVIKRTNEIVEELLKQVDAGIDFKFSNLIRDGKIPISKGKADALGIEDDEICTLAGALENIVKASQLEIIDLQHSIDKLRAESNLLKEHVEAQAKELENRTNRIMELEEKERVANESIEGLMMDIAASEEEITRWKVAAEQEAAAGRAVEDEFLGQLSALKQELEETKGTMLESEKKLKFKEETAAAAMAARDAAEKSLSLADLRASRLRDRVEELVHQLEEFERREDSTGLNASRYVCWPWQWLGLDFVGFSRHDMLNQQSSNEMELSEPLM